MVHAVVSVGYAFGQVSEKVMSDASSGLGLVMLLAFLRPRLGSEQATPARPRAQLKRTPPAGSSRKRTGAPPSAADKVDSPCQTGLRSSSSIEIPSGPRRKAMRTPGRMVLGSIVNSAPLALSPATTSSMPVTVSPKWSSP